MVALHKPDFSGAYRLNREASMLSAGAAAVQSGVLRVEHHEPMVRCQAAFAFAGDTFEYSLERVSDGREIVGRTEGVTTVSTLHWEGHALVFTDRDSGPDAEVTMTWRYELDDDGRRLRAAEQIRGGSRDQDNVWIFERI